MNRGTSNLSVYVTALIDNPRILERQVCIQVTLIRDYITLHLLLRHTQMTDFDLSVQFKTEIDFR